VSDRCIWTRLWPSCWVWGLCVLRPIHFTFGAKTPKESCLYSNIAHFFSHKTLTAGVVSLKLWSDWLSLLWWAWLLLLFWLMTSDPEVFNRRRESKRHQTLINQRLRKVEMFLKNYRKTKISFNQLCISLFTIQIILKQIFNHSALQYTLTN